MPVLYMEFSEENVAIDFNDIAMIDYDNKCLYIRLKNDQNAVRWSTSLPELKKVYIIDATEMKTISLKDLALYYAKTKAGFVDPNKITSINIPF